MSNLRLFIVTFPQLGRVEAVAAATPQAAAKLAGDTMMQLIDDGHFMRLGINPGHSARELAVTVTTVHGVHLDATVDRPCGLGTVTRTDSLADWPDAPADAVAIMMATNA